MQSPSFLSHQRALSERKGQSNLQTLFHNVKISSDNHIRQMLDGISTDHFDSVFFKVISDIRSHQSFERFKVIDGRVLIALDGSKYFNSYKISGPNCSTRKHKNGQVKSFHQLLGAAMVTAGQNIALPLPAEFISSQDGAKKQDCQQMAAGRWLENIVNHCAS